jgi:hypothetical protein
MIEWLDTASQRRRLSALTPVGRARLHGNRSEIMPDTPARSRQFRATVSEHAVATVERAQNQEGGEGTSVLVSLRDLKDMARREYQCRDTIQIIAPGRRLLGDDTLSLPMDASGARSRRSSGAGNSHRELNLHE